MASLSDTAELPELDSTNAEFNQALDFVKHTNRLVYLTGKAGTGKTTFLKHLKATSKKNVVILAPTGVAAINAGGETIHSFLQIRPSLYVPNDPRLRETPPDGDTDRSTIYDHFRYRSEKKEILRALDLLVIDEVSMVRCDLLDVVDRLLRVFRGKRNVPFGGVQTVLIGDAFQLPPVAKQEDWNILGQFYSSPFFFSSKVLEAHKPIYIELKKIYRQKEEEFIALLNRVRVSEVSQPEMLVLNGRLDPSFEPDPSKGYITLGTHNAQVDTINEAKLGALETPLFEFKADIQGDFPERSYPTDSRLRLKVGAQVMFLKNNKEAGVYNGSIGRVTELDDNRVVVTMPDEKVIVAQKYVWRNIRYTWDKEAHRVREEELGTFTQYPLRLAWAITVHKSQGLTFEKVIADIGSAFASGQVYVALSRCTSFNGLVLKSRIDRSAIKTDRDVIHFAEQETPATLIVEELNSGRADSHYLSARIAFKAGHIAEAYDELLTAFKYRNDVSTDLFRRYITVHLRRIASRAARYGDLDQRHQEVLVQILALSEGLKDQLEVKEELDQNVATLVGENTALKHEVGDMRGRVMELVRKEHEQQLMLATLKTKLRTLENELSTAQKLVRSHEMTLRDCYQKIHYQQWVIKDFRDMPWWKRLWEK